MKKILMTLAVAFVAVAANAQVYVGGNVGIASSKNGDADAVTTYKVLPEIGYNLDQNWAIGTTVGFGKGTPVNIEKPEDGMLQNYFTVEPYVRYTFYAASTSMRSLTAASVMLTSTMPMAQLLP